MSRKRYTPEQIIGMLREAELRLSQGHRVGGICRSLGISEQSYYRWRREYGGLKVDQAKRLPADSLKPAGEEVVDEGRTGDEVALDESRYTYGGSIIGPVFLEKVAEIGIPNTGYRGRWVLGIPPL